MDRGEKARTSLLSIVSKVPNVYGGNVKLPDLMGLLHGILQCALPNSVCGGWCFPELELARSS